MNRRGMLKSPNRKSGRNPLSRALGILLAVTILCSAFLFGDNAVAPIAAEGLNLTERVADPATHNQMGFVDIPGVHDGRIWTDKTVTTAEAGDAFNITLSALSQSISNTVGYAIPSDIVIIIDVSGSMAQYAVPGTSLSRIAVLADALNEAFDILMAANEHNRIAVVAYGGRSGGWARVEHVMDLGRYGPAADGTFFSVDTRGTLPSGTANTMRVNAVAVPDSGGRVATTSLAVIGSTPTQWGVYHGTQILLNVPDADRYVRVENTAEGDPTHYWVTRRPNIILMTDGEPTMGWPNWAFDESIDTFGSNPLGTGQLGSTGVQLNMDEGGRFYGDGSYGEMGLSILNVLTAAYRKREVLEHYFGEWNNNLPPTSGSDAGDQPAQPIPNVGWFNISLGQLDRPLINAMMNPFGEGNVIYPNNVTGGNVIGSNPELGSPISMQDRLRSFADPNVADISFHALFRERYLRYNWTHEHGRVTIANHATEPLTELEINYIHPRGGFHAANDVEALRQAFITIANSIHNDTIFGEVTNASPGEEDIGGWLVISDVLGEYMQFRGTPTLTFPAFMPSLSGGADGLPAGRPHPSPEARPIDLSNERQRSDFEAILEDHFNYQTEPQFRLTPQQVTALVNASVAAGFNNSVRYFADRNRNFVANYHPTVEPAGADAMVEIFPMTGMVYSFIDDGIDGRSGYINLNHVAFHVVTALRGGTFSEIANLTGAAGPTYRTLVRGDQLIRWYIPLSLIPLRNVEQAETAGDEIDRVRVAGNTDPVRVTFTVGLDQERVSAGISAEYFEANTVDGRTFFYSNRWQGTQNVSLAFFQPGESNPFYRPGRPGANDALGTVTKRQNPTQTVDHVVRTLSFGSEPVDTDIHWLGNNGRLTLVYPVVDYDPGIPETGDENRIGLYVAIMLIALFLVGGTVFVYIRMRRKSNN